LTQSEQSAILRKEEKQGLAEYIVDCIRETRPRVIGNDKGRSWRRYFPNTVSEIVFEKSVKCTFIPMIYILQEARQTIVSVQHIKNILWDGYKYFWETWPEKIISILRKQGTLDLMDLLAKSDFEKVLFSDAYYLTDLDWWVFAHSEKFPIILFSSTSLKYLANSINWLRLGSSEKQNEKYYFIRSPVDVKSNTPPNYHVLNTALRFDQLTGDDFLKAERGMSEYRENMQSLDDYLKGYTLIQRKMKS
jgi:hypothetical protein